MGEKEKELEVYKYAKIIITMSTDFLQGGLSEQTYYQNLKIATNSLERLVNNYK